VSSESASSVGSVVVIQFELLFEFACVRISCSNFLFEFLVRISCSNFLFEFLVHLHFGWLNGRLIGWLVSTRTYMSVSAGSAR
jgi:hypothetical protein